jgi:CubicO group peptidase (beta-lactamase class C family)
MNTENTYFLKEKLTMKIANLPLELTEAEIAAHVIAPDHVNNIEIEEVNEAREVRYAIPLQHRQFAVPPRLNVDAFGKAMHNALKDSVTGYILQLRQNGNLIYNLIWNWSQTPADKKQGWTEDTRMHVASVSKLLTAIGLVKLLDSKNISYDSKIINYLPTYWKKGKNIDKITFRHLLTHTSGFTTGGSSSNYSFMKSKVADGVNQVGSYDYENMNFGLCRILMPIINGDISKNQNFPSLIDIFQDQAWDLVTLSHYKNYMQAKVFTPAGVNNVDFKPLSSTKNALAYQFPHKNQDGWDSGNLAAVAGGAGWRLSTKELLNVMDHLRRKNTIIAPQKAQYLLDNYFGIDQVINTPAGKIYNKNGLWRNGSGQTEQSVVYFFPNNMELAMFVNSPIGESKFSLRGIVKDTFINSLSA